ncbi:Rne/Rng family ribonuclease [Bifidobacterium pullorum]|uniref:Rne/Rng family ribonuclease n=1 Tax=Bifidobacterium pullorum TaxID=78448 RepID=UPI000529BF2F|nr:Rne/Rng family ribonuclease [Bifidobacterium pullorum]
MPRVNREGFDEVEAADQSLSEASSSETAAPRRRRGRRVTRDVGAAGATVALKVEDHSLPLFEEPHLPSRGESKPVSEAAREDAEPTPTRRRTRRRADAEQSESAQVFHSPFSDAAGDDRAFDAVAALPEGHEPRRQPRPMTSLLFQEPVLPESRPRPVHDDEEEDGQEDRPASRRSRSRRARGREEERIEVEEERTEEESRPSRRRRAASAEDRDENRHDREEQEHADTADAESTRSSRRSRRLNAQERRAAAEVEQIEEDLELDDITYLPIDEERPTKSDDEEEGTTRRRRRRSRGGNREERANEDRPRDEHEEHPRESSREDENDDEEQTVSRRRRRRRGAKAEQEQEQPLVRRSRKQQYIDEITDVEGSTRLEAKKQRRRDNRRERSRQNQLMEQDFLARRESVERLMVVRERERHTQISVIEDNILVEHYVSDIQEVATVGNIYLGRVQNVLPSMEAAFVDIGQARNGVLYAGEVNWDTTRLEGQPRRIELAFKSGDPVLVQVTKDPIGHKGARLTSQVTLAGRFLVLVPSGGMTGVSRKLSERERSRLKGIVSKIAPKDMGVIIRTAAEGASEEAIVKDLETLVHQWERITAKRDEFLHGKRPKLLQGEPDVAIRVVRDIFNDDFDRMIVEGDKVYARIEEYLDTMAPDLKGKLEKWDPAEHEGKDVFDKWQIDSQLRKGMERQVYLPSGGSIVIDRTEAMTTIDVNTGRFIGRGKSLEETVTRCNLEASEEIARQLRLRDIGGMVMIDYVDMVMPANRDLVLRRLVECLARDRTKHQVAEVTSLGLVQMTRKRIGQGLVEAFSEECPTCKGRGFILHDEPTVSADFDDPYALKGGDPFVKTNKHGQGTQVQVPQGSSPDVKAKLAQIAAAAVAASAED